MDQIQRFWLEIEAMILVIQTVQLIFQMMAVTQFYIQIEWIYIPIQLTYFKELCNHITFDGVLERRTMKRNERPTCHIVVFGFACQFDVILM